MNEADFAGIDTANKRIGKKILYYDTISSTNDVAKAMAQSQGLVEGAVVITNAQTQGKGRLGRQWEATAGEDIALSIVLRPEKNIAEAAQITLLLGIAAAKTIWEYTDLPVGIKWPNDVVINGKKVCGILTEAVQGGAMIAGIGINVNSRSFDSPGLWDKATSLLIEGERSFHRVPLIRRLLGEFDHIYDQFLEEGLKALMPEYRKLCVNLGRKVKAVRNEEELIGTAVAVSDKGELIVALADGKEVSLFSGEVSVRGIYGYI